MDAVLVIAFYAVVAGLIVRVRRFGLAAGALGATLLLALALIIQALAKSSVAGYAALALTFVVVMLGLALHLTGAGNEET